MITLGHQENDKSFWIFKAAFVWPLLLPLPWPSLSPSIHGILPDWTVYLLLVPTLEFSLITPDPHYSASSSSFSCVFFLVINRNYSYLFYHYFEWVSILLPIFWIVIVIHNERTFQSICKCFWLIFLHLFMKIWTRVSLHLWPKFWCFFKVSPHFCKALVHDLYMAHTLPNFAKRKWIYFLSLSLWGNSFFWTWKKLPLHPWETHMLFLKKLEGHRSISTSQHGTPYYIQQCFNLLQHRSWILGQLGKQEDETFDTAIFRSSTPRVAL